MAKRIKRGSVPDFPKFRDLIKRNPLPPLTDDLKASGKSRSDALMNMLKSGAPKPRKKR